MADMDEHERMVRDIGRFIIDQDNLIKERIAALEARITELESRGYKGVYQRSNAYRRHDSVSCRGSLWMALKDIAPGEMPGVCADWQLAVKRGRNGFNPQRNLTSEEYLNGAKV
jgi:hypothetical protein